jgi:hypothetical protein
MNRILITLLALLGWQYAADSQTLTITPTTVEVVSQGAKTRAFYPIDDVFLTNTFSGGVVVRDASSGTILFNGDTSEVTIAGATLWSAKHAVLNAYYLRVPYDTMQHPITYLPRKGLNFLYRNSNATVTAIHGRTKYSLWTGNLSSMVDTGVIASTALAWVRTVLQRDAVRSAEQIGTAATVAAGAAAGTSPTITASSASNSGRIDLTSGTTALTTGNIAVVTLPNAYDTMYITVTPANATAGAHVARVWAEQLTSTTFAIKASGTALADATAYKWYWQVIGKSATPGP